MRISDLLRKAADLVDQYSGNAATGGEMGAVNVNNIDNTDTATMISPLQQKHELLKKVSNVANDTEKFDDPMSDDGSCEQAPDDELDIIKKLTGLTTETDNAVIAAHFIADDHESD
mgnify:CR=1 FL=1